MSGLLHELNQFIDRDTLVVTDAGDVLFAVDDIKMQEGSSFLMSGVFTPAWDSECLV